MSAAETSLAFAPEVMRWLLLVPVLLMGVLMVALPTLIKRGLLFGVPLPEQVRKGTEGLKAIAQYRLVVGIVAGLSVAAGAVLPQRPAMISEIAGPFFISIAAFWQHFRQHYRLRPYALNLGTNGPAALSLAPDPLPAWVWLNVVPLAILAAAAIYLRAHWSEIPVRFPVHYGIDGQPNRWSERTVRGVFGPLFIALGVTLQMALACVATWVGARRRIMRKTAIKMLLVMSCFLAVVFSAVALAPLYRSLVWVAIVTIPVPILAVFFFVRASQKADDEAEPTPIECWYGGMFYYNPHDAALMVEARQGYGYTLNFGNSWAWLMILSMLAVPMSLPFILG